MSPPTSPIEGSPAQTRSDSPAQWGIPIDVRAAARTDTLSREDNDEATLATDYLAPGPDPTEANADKINVPLTSTRYLPVAAEKPSDRGSAEPQGTQTQITANQAAAPTDNPRHDLPGEANVPPGNLRNFFVRRLHKHPRACKAVWAWLLSCFALGAFILLVMLTGGEDNDGRGQLDYPLSPEAAGIVKRDEYPFSCDPEKEMCPFLLVKCGDGDDCCMCSWF